MGAVKSAHFCLGGRGVSEAVKAAGTRGWAVDVTVCLESANVVMDRMTHAAGNGSGESAEVVVRAKCMGPSPCGLRMTCSGQ